MEILIGVAKISNIFWYACYSWYFWRVNSRCWVQAYEARKNERIPPHTLRLIGRRGRNVSSAVPHVPQVLVLHASLPRYSLWCCVCQDTWPPAHGSKIARCPVLWYAWHTAMPWDVRSSSSCRHVGLVFLLQWSIPPQSSSGTHHLVKTKPKVLFTQISKAVMIRHWSRHFLENEWLGYLVLKYFIHKGELYHWLYFYCGYGWVVSGRAMPT